LLVILVLLRPLLLWRRYPLLLWILWRIVRLGLLPMLMLMCWWREICRLLLLLLLLLLEMLLRLRLPFMLSWRRLRRRRLVVGGRLHVEIVCPLLCGQLSHRIHFGVHNLQLLMLRPHALGVVNPRPVGPVLVNTPAPWDHANVGRAEQPFCCRKGKIEREKQKAK
jgi:hypothetical protein